MEDSGPLFITLGATFLLGLAADAVGRRTRLPRVTLLLLLGFLIGPGCLDLLPEGRETLFTLAANVALTMVGFLLGDRVGKIVKKGGGKEMLAISISVVVMTVAAVSLALFLAGLPIEIALLLGGIATATDPAATSDVVRESGAGKGRFAGLLLAIVAVDDAWGLLAFSLILSAAQIITGNGAEVGSLLLGGLVEIVLALGIGGALGIVMALLTGRISPGEPTRLEATGFVFLIAGISLLLDFSFILAAMVMGTVVALRAKHHKQPFHEIERLELPFLILFFVLAGAALELDSITTVGFAGGCYVVARVLGRIAGGWIGGRIARSDKVVRRWIGASMMPQAGVAIGMALLAAEKFPEFADTMLQVTIGTTVLFEVTGPILTRMALDRADGEPAVAPDESA